MKNFILILISACLFISCGQTKKTNEDVLTEDVVAEKLIALSFDDGPNTTTTVQTLDMLEKHGVVGSFFVIGNNINDSSIPVMKRAFEMGCDIQNHSLTHVPMTELTPEQIKEEIASTTHLIEQHVGVRPTFFRPPYIAVNQTMYDNIELPFICGAGCNDWEPQVTAEQRAETVIKNAEDGQIVLLHDLLGNDATVAALDIIIPALKEQGFRFVTVPQLFKAKNVAPQGNKLYTNVLKD